MELQTTAAIQLSPLTVETAQPHAAKILLEAKKSLGFIPNMYALMANNPALLDAYTQAYHTFRANSGFNSKEQEIILLAVAHENACEYCVAAHSFVADKMSGVPAEVTDAIRNGEQVADTKLNALVHITRLITKYRGRISQEDVEAFFAAGYTEQQLLGVITGVGVKTLSNYFNHVVQTPLDAVFEPRRWTPNSKNN